MEKLVERFLTYMKVSTRSDTNSRTTSMAVGQAVLVKVIETELHELGLIDVHYNEQNNFLTTRLPGNQPTAKSIGLIVHLDMAGLSAENIRPQVITNYDGQDVLLNQEQGIILSVAEFPSLKEYQEETLATTDGTTLLGTDDKTGIVEILAAVEHFLTHPEVAWGDVWLTSGPDEETGRGIDQFDVPNFPITFAYMIGSGRVGYFEYETFNAAQAVITIEETSVHPGTAYGSLVNAIKLDEQLNQSLP